MPPPFHARALSLARGVPMPSAGVGTSRGTRSQRPCRLSRGAGQVEFGSWDPLLGRTSVCVRASAFPSEIGVGAGIAGSGRDRRMPGTCCLVAASWARASGAQPSTLTRSHNVLLWVIGWSTGVNPASAWGKLAPACEALMMSTFWG